MPPFKKPILPELVSELIPVWWFPRRPVVRILVVVDSAISLIPAATFGVSKVLDIIRKTGDFAGDTEFSYVQFQVETATRASFHFLGTPDHLNFRFDAKDASDKPILDRWDQIWLFGFDPGNTGSSSDNALQTDPLRLSSSEVDAITAWMKDKRGGMLAMGDHHFLGATLAHQIPRVRSMRRWTNAQAVPPIDAPIQTGAGPIRERHDTNQPQSAAQSTPGSGAVIPNTAEQDAIPQPLEVRRYASFRRKGFGVELVRRPHPILCDQVYGVIDVFPDHPHEGWVYEDDEINLDAPLKTGSTLKEFPDAVDGGSKPAPQALAHANPWTEPPYQHQKTPTSVRRFAVLGAYDGHRANVGRVVVDSTWHHWFDMNLNGLHEAGTAATATADQKANWHKIMTYFRNCAVWLSPPRKQDAMLSFAAYWSTGSALAPESYDGGMPSWELGESARDILGQLVGPCTLSSWLFPYIPVEVFEPRRPDWPCLSCPPIDRFEDVVLGGIIREMLPVRAQLAAAALRGEKPKLEAEALEQTLGRGAHRGLGELAERWDKEVEVGRKTHELLRGALDRRLGHTKKAD